MQITQFSQRKLDTEDDHRVSNIRCVWCTPISLSTVSSWRVDQPWKSVTSWGRRCVTNISFKHLFWLSYYRPYVMSRCLTALRLRSRRHKRTNWSLKESMSKMFHSQVRLGSLSWFVPNWRMPKPIAASIQGSCRVRNKDIRKFLDGIYVSEKGTIVQEWSCLLFCSIYFIVASFSFAHLRKVCISHALHPVDIMIHASMSRIHGV